MFREAFKFIDIKRKVLCVDATWKSIATDGRRRYSVSEHQQQQTARSGGSDVCGDCVDVLVEVFLMV